MRETLIPWPFWLAANQPLVTTESYEDQAENHVRFWRMEVDLYSEMGRAGEIGKRALKVSITPWKVPPCCCPDCFLLRCLSVTTRGIDDLCWSVPAIKLWMA